MGAHITGHLSILEVSGSQIVIFNELSNVVFHDIFMTCQEFIMADHWRSILLSLSIFVLDRGPNLLIRAQITAII